MRLSPLRWWPLLLLIPLALGFSRLRFDTDVLGLLPRHLPAVRGLQLHQQHFANAGELIVTLQSDDAGITEECARSLTLALRAHPAVNAEVHWTPPWLEHPDQAAELAAYRWLNQAPAAVGALAERLAPERLAPALAEVRARLALTLSPEDLSRGSYDPFELGRLPGTAGGAGQPGDTGEELFASEDGRFRLVRLRARDPLPDYRSCARWLESVRTAIEAWGREEPAAPGVRVGYTGRPAFVAEIAGSLERDLALPSLGTLLAIAVLFYAVHRRWLPLLWLLALLLGILLGTLALGGLWFGTLNVVSVGFAAILLGLAEDFGIVLYQEARCHPDRPAAAIRREVMPGILWSALACSGAFLLLNLSGLPGLGQLGSLVALGIGLAAWVMLTAYLPPLLRRSGTPGPADPTSSPVQQGPATTVAQRGSRAAGGSVVSPWSLTALVSLLGLITVCVRPPTFDRSPDALKPRQSAASATTREIREHLGPSVEPWWVVMEARDLPDLRDRMAEVERTLAGAAADGIIASSVLPTALLPDPDHQRANRSVLRELAGRQDEFREAARRQGFRPDSLAFTERLFEVWRRAGATTNVFWPTNACSRWVLDQCVARAPAGMVALGLVHPREGAAAEHAAAFAGLGGRLSAAGVWLAGWEMLGPTLVERVLRELPRVLIPILVLVLGILWMALRRWSDVVLSVAALGFGLGGLAALMGLAGWSWNMMNLTAVPLLLGLGVDFTLHIQLALKRHRGDLARVHHSVGRALLLAGATTCAGFVSLAGSSNAGLASLGRVCAAGIATILLTSVYLLPAWWQALAGPGSAAPASETAAPRGLSGPSRLYRAAVWRLGLAAVRRLPIRLCEALGRLAGLAFWAFQARRRRVVEANLLPVVGNDPAKAARAARSLFAHFGVKIAELWHYESGRSIEHQIGELKGADVLAAAVARGRGLLLVTPHLGNWELGAPLTARRGVQVLAITQAEPDRDLTRLRIESRARWGIETLVIQEDPFAFVEVIRRLESGATVALLVDRPHPATSVTVELFGRRIEASVAPAELARATGCSVLPVCVFKDSGAYAAHVLPEIHYDRASLRQLEARVRLTQEILRAFEPVIRQHPDQWYHFVPIWAPDAGGGPGPGAG